MWNPAYFFFVLQVPNIILSTRSRTPEAPVRIGVLERVDNVKMGRGRPKLTWDESVKRDLRIGISLKR